MSETTIDRSESQVPDERANETPLARRTPAPSAVPTFIEMMDRMQAMALTADQMGKTLDLYERLTERQAREEFARAMAQFQKDCPPIPKTAKASITTRAGGSYGYTYAPLEEIAARTAPHLQANGLMYSWDGSEADGKITAICTVRHVNGQSVTSHFTASVETSAAMSGAQKHAAAMTYARRQSLIMALGLVTTDPDTDGAGHQKITENQAANLRAMMDELKVAVPGFLKVFGVAKIEDMPQAKFQVAINLLEEKRARAKP